MAVETAIVRGEFFTAAVNSLRYDVVDADGAAQTMTGWSLEWVVRDRYDTAVITKTTVSGITIGNGAGTDTRATVTVDVADTASLTLSHGPFTYTLWRTDSTNDVPLAFGSIVITKVASQ